MAVYQSTQQFYHTAAILFTRMQQEHAESVASLEQGQLAVLVKHTNPDGEFTLDARTPPATAVMGPTNIPTDLQITIDTDTLHAILLGQQTITKAIGRRQIVFKGSIRTAMALADLFEHCREVYTQILDSSTNP